VATTPLQDWLDTHRIPAARLESLLRDELETQAPSRQQLLRWRYNRAGIRRERIIQIVWACRVLGDDPYLTADELFGLNPDHPANWPLMPKRYKDRRS
jgi:hypothetical protein